MTYTQKIICIAASPLDLELLVVALSVHVYSSTPVRIHGKASLSAQCSWVLLHSFYSRNTHHLILLSLSWVTLYFCLFAHTLLRMSSRFFPTRPNRGCSANDRQGLTHELGPLHDGKEIAAPVVENLEKQDPFGNENGTAVKYKTMAWW